MDRDDGVLAVVLAAEHLLGLGRLDLERQRVEAAREIRKHVFARGGPFDQHGQILFTRAQAVDEIALLLEPAAALEHFLRLGLVLPEIGGSGALLEFRQLLGGVRGLKDNLGVRSNASRGPGSGG